MWGGSGRGAQAAIPPPPLVTVSRGLTFTNKSRSRNSHGAMAQDTVRATRYPTQLEETRCRFLRPSSWRGGQRRGHGAA